MDADDNPHDGPNPNLPPRKTKRIPWREIEAEYLTGLSSRDDLARKYGVARTTIFARFRREKIDIRRAEYMEAMRREVVERLAGPVAERLIAQLERSLCDMEKLRKEIVAAGAGKLTSAGAQILRTEAEVLLRYGKGIRLFEPDAPPAGATAGAGSAQSFIQDVQATVRAIEEDATAAGAEAARSEDAAPDGRPLHPDG